MRARRRRHKPHARSAAALAPARDPIPILFAWAAADRSVVGDFRLAARYSSSLHGATSFLFQPVSDQTKSKALAGRPRACAKLAMAALLAGRPSVVQATSVRPQAALAKAHARRRLAMIIMASLRDRRLTIISHMERQQRTAPTRHPMTEAESALSSARAPEFKAIKGARRYL
jgi:hypothetical protein